MKTFHKQLKIIVFILLIFSSICVQNSSLFSDTRKTIYTPEGKSLYGWEMTEASSGDLEDWYDWAQEEIDDLDLNANRISYSTRKYNCHGYTFMKSENRGEHWIGYSASENDPEETFFTDQSHSNDGQASYISNASSSATHIYYNGGDHSVRKIQNSYPVTVQGGRNCVSKWNMGPLVQHEQGDDTYWQQGGQTMVFYKLKTTHYGTLSNYEKTWIGAGGITHTVTDSIVCPNTLTIKSGASVNLGNSKYIKCTGSGKIVKQGSVSGYKHYAMSGSYYKGFFPSSISIQQLIDSHASFGWNIHLSSDTYGNINMKEGVGLVGAGESSTTIDGTVTFNNDDNAGLALVTVTKKISITNSDFVDLALKTTGNCYIEATGSVIDVDDITSHTSYSKAIYAHTYSDLEIWAGSIKNKSAVAVPVYYYSSGLIEEVYFCQNNIDISADPPGTETYYCTFSSSQEGESVEGDVYWDEWDWCGLSKQLVKSGNTTLSKEIIASNGDEKGLSDYREGPEYLAYD